MKTRPVDFEERILFNHKQLVSNDSILIHMGDVCMGDDAKQNTLFLESVSQARTKILIPGNHDNKSISWYYDIGWDFVARDFTMSCFGVTLLFSHTPSLMVENAYQHFNIHGHTHANGHHAIDVAHYYDRSWHKEFALEQTDYYPVLLDDKLIRKLQASPISTVSGDV